MPLTREQLADKLVSRKQWVEWILTCVDVHETTHRKPFWPDDMSAEEIADLIYKLATSLTEDADGGFLDHRRKWDRWITP